MRLCDECITVLKNDLSEEAIAVLNKIELFNELSERDLIRKLSLNHKHLKKLLYELEVKLFLTYESYGRTKAYHLTENGSRLLRLEEETEIDVNFKDESEPEISADTDNNSNQVGEEENFDKTEEDVQEEESDEQQLEKEETNLKQEEESEDNSDSKDDNIDQDSEKGTAKSSDDQSENLVWDFK